MSIRLIIVITGLLFAGLAHAERVVYELPGLATNYPSTSGSWSGCVPLTIAEAPTQVLAATFVAEGVVTAGVYLCPDQPAWGMIGWAVLYFANSGDQAASADQKFDGPFAASFDLQFDDPVEVSSSHTVFICFSLRPVHPVCLGEPFPSGTVTLARLVLDLATVEVADKTWGGIKALYR